MKNYQIFFLLGISILSFSFSTGVFLSEKVKKIAIDFGTDSLLYQKIISEFDIYGNCTSQKNIELNNSSRSERIDFLQKLNKDGKPTYRATIIDFFNLKLIEKMTYDIQGNLLSNKSTLFRNFRKTEFKTVNHYDENDSLVLIENFDFEKETMPYGQAFEYEKVKDTIIKKQFRFYTTGGRRLEKVDFFYKNKIVQTQAFNLDGVLAKDSQYFFDDDLKQTLTIEHSCLWNERYSIRRYFKNYNFEEVYEGMNKLVSYSKTTTTDNLNSETKSFNEKEELIYHSKSIYFSNGKIKQSIVFVDNGGCLSIEGVKNYSYEYY